MNVLVNVYNVCISELQSMSCSLKTCKAGLTLQEFWADLILVLTDNQLRVLDQNQSRNVRGLQIQSRLIGPPPQSNMLILRVKILDDYILSRNTTTNERGMAMVSILALEDKVTYYYKALYC